MTKTKLVPRRCRSCGETKDIRQGEHNCAECAANRPAQYWCSSTNRWVDAEPLDRATVPRIT